MTKNKHLMEIINKYSFSIVELHEKLGIKGEYFENGLYEGRSPEEVQKGISSYTDRYYIKTTKQGASLAEKNRKINTIIIEENIFTAGLLKEKLGLEGYIESLNKEENNYIIITTNKK